VLRRVLPIAAAAAALVAVPSTAFATAPQAPVENMFSAGYYGYTDLGLPDGRHVYATLSAYRAASQNGWSGALSVTVGVPCPDDPSCLLSDASGTALLTETQVAFSRNLDGASAVDVPVTLWTSPSDPLPSDGSGDPSGEGSADAPSDGSADAPSDGSGDAPSDGTGDGMPEPTSEQVTVSLTFSGTGAVARDSYKGDQCGDGMRLCQSHRVSADRDATVEFSLDRQSASGLDRQSASGAGHLNYTLGTDTAAPKFGPGGP
jgi:hypothetical protein